MTSRLEKLINEIEIHNENLPLFYTENFLVSTAHTIVKGAEQIYKTELILDILCKKIDVTKKVYIIYEKDLSSAFSKKELSSTSMEILLIILLHYAFIYNNYKFLNSTLKILDLHCFEKNYMNDIEKVLISNEKYYE